MPCYDPRDSQDLAEAEQRVQKLTRMLCSTLEHSSGFMTKETKEWWDEHQRVDAERLRVEEFNRRQAGLRAQARQKLSEEEWEALGLP